MATIEIDGKSYEAQPGQMLIEIADANGIDIPRFCYHKKLSVAANCRMCLVEVERAPKPLPACATPIMDGMKVYTKSSKALAAQNAVMEFLLINHPLDCPICDQGGECELQDIAMGYGQDVSRYQDGKRVVTDKNLGPLIATEMTRCIHCTRCVRFGEEIAGIKELGATGRGEHTRIGTYVEKTVNSELSGNVVDLCPVGALTNKPFRFSARAWEMQQRVGVSVHDGVGASVYYHTRRNEVMRVIPRENETVNETWLADRDRYSFSALKAEDRLTQPMIKRDGQWQAVDWETALTFAADGLKQAVQKHGAKQVGSLVSPTSTLEELFLLQKLMRGMGSSNIDHRLQQMDFSDQAQAPVFPSLGQSLTDFEHSDAVLVIGSHLRKEQPLLNLRLRKAAMRGAKCAFVNPVAYEFNLPVAQQLVVTPNDWVSQLAGIAKALQTSSSNSVNGLDGLLQNVSVSAEQQAVADALLSGERKTVLVGQLAQSHPQFASLRALAGAIAQLSGACLSYTNAAGNTSGAWLTGCVPHRAVGGQAESAAGKNALEMLSEGLKAYILMGVEPELESCVPAQAERALKRAEFVVNLTAFRSPAMDAYADVLLPIALSAETSGTYVNMAGTWQSVAAAVKAPADVRPAWKVLRVFGNLFDLAGFDYEDSTQIQAELQPQLMSLVADNAGSWQLPSSLDTAASQGLQAITELPIYAVDMVVRRTAALQDTQDALSVKGVHLSATTAASLKIKDGQAVQVQQASNTVASTAVFDERVPAGCVLLYAAQADSTALDSWFGDVTVKPVD